MDGDGQEDYALYIYIYCTVYIYIYVCVLLLHTHTYAYNEEVNQTPKCPNIFWRTRTLIKIAVEEDKSFFGHRAYSLFFIVGTLGAIQIPVVGMQPLRSLEALP